MNVLWLSHNVPYPPIGGVLQRSYHLLKHIATEHRVHLLAFNQKALHRTTKEVAHAEKALKHFCSSVEIFPIASDASRLKWCKLVAESFFTEEPYTINWTKSQEMHNAIRNLAAKIKIDIAHFDTIGMVEYFNDIKEPIKILNHHNIESLMMRRRSEKEGNLLRKAYFYFEAKKIEAQEKMYLSKVNLNLVVSEPDAQRIRQLDPNCHVEIIENGTDIDFFESDASVPQDVGHLLFVGGLKWYPNRDAMDYFCESIWPELIRRHENLRFTVVGAHPPKHLIKKGYMDQRIKVTGYVDDVRVFFQRADIFVCPIRDGGGTRLKVLDAMAMGKAIVATSIGCEGIDVVPGKDVLIANSPSEFVSQITFLLSNPALKRELGNRARKLAVEKYSWSRIGTHLLKVYKNLGSAGLGLRW